MPAAILSMSTPFAQAQDEPPNACNNNSPLPYPRDASKRGEAGMSLIGFLVRADGTVDRTLVLGHSHANTAVQLVQTSSGISILRFVWPIRQGDHTEEEWNDSLGKAIGAGNVSAFVGQECQHGRSSPTRTWTAGVATGSWVT
jgi:hypothetical protein